MFQPCLQSSEATRLLVTGHASVEDLWALFSSFGEISSIVLVEGGAKVTFLQEETLNSFYQSGEILFGQQKVVVTKIKEREDQESLATRFSLPPPPPLTLTNLEFLPPVPPFSPQYEASILRSPQPTPPPQHQPKIFTFDSSSFLEAESVCQVARQEHFLQPLTPLTPGPPPPPPRVVPLKVCQANSLYFTPGSAPTPASSDSSDTNRHHTVFSSPYKKFVKFQVWL